MKPSSAAYTFQYALKVSKRVRGVKIAVKPYQGLEVVIPPRFPRYRIDGILQHHADWINRQLQKHADSFKAAELPEQLDINLDGKHYDICYQEADRASLVLCESTNSLLIRHQNTHQVIDLLRQQVRKLAWQLLPPMLQAIADELGFSYRKVSIRSQKTRWGSCSSSGTINLNDQLIFLPSDSVRYLMIHELCHTRHMNHSSAFWQLVAQHCTDYRRLDSQLSQARQHVPDWFSRSLLSR